MANAFRKAIDTTQLSLEMAEDRGFLHRDYIAHCLRWSHVIKRLTRLRGEYGILDVGCGQETPLAKLLYTNRIAPKWYIGLDYNKTFKPLEKLLSLNWFNAYSSVDFAKHVVAQTEGFSVISENVKYKFNQLPSIITCFEVLEHVEPNHAIKMLRVMRTVADKDTEILISTPCYNGKAAANHVNEMTYEALGALFEDLGFEIKEVYGTFASKKDIFPVFKEQYGYVAEEYYERLSQYYDSNLMSIMLAPLYPEASRNAMWVLKSTQPIGYRRRFKKLTDCLLPWGSSELFTPEHLEY